MCCLPVFCKGMLFHACFPGVFDNTFMPIFLCYVTANQYTEHVVLELMSQADFWDYRYVPSWLFFFGGSFDMFGAKSEKFPEGTPN